MVLELTSHGERLAESGHLEKLMSKWLGLDKNFPIFVPYVTVDKKDSAKILYTVTEGYVFVGSNLPGHAYSALNDCPYVNGTLSVGRRGAISTIPDASVQSLRVKLGEMISSNIREGESVVISDGPLSGMEGIAITVNSTSVQVYFKFRSLQVLRNFPNYMVKPAGEAGPEGGDKDGE